MAGLLVKKRTKILPNAGVVLCFETKLSRWDDYGCYEGECVPGVFFNVIPGR